MMKEAMHWHTICETVLSTILIIQVPCLQWLISHPLLSICFLVPVSAGPVSSTNATAIVLIYPQLFSSVKLVLFV